jgi:hypothetical protein
MVTQDWVVDGSGKLHDWRAEIADYFMDIQLGNGGWGGNPQIGWREEEPDIAGLYALLSIQAAYLMVPDPELALQVTGGSSARFIDPMGNVLVSDVTRGLTVTDSSLTCTDPELFRKLWVVIEGSEGTKATVAATGSWGEDRSSTASREVELGKGGALVHVSAGGFAGPFGIHLTGFDRAPSVQMTDGSAIKIDKGETKVITIGLEETTGESVVTGATLIIPEGEGVVADVDRQGQFITSGGTGGIELTISVNATFDGKGFDIVVLSSTAPPIVMKVKVTDETEEEIPGMMFWVVILALFILVGVFFVLPVLGRKEVG